MEVSVNNPVGSLDSMRNQEIKSFTKEAAQKSLDEAKVQQQRQTETDRVEIENKNYRAEQQAKSDDAQSQANQQFNEDTSSGRNVDFTA